ncbi:hypothetical protein P7K49_012372 [Saguinus oedipus]|uniref:Uncharacterized protein n=1 Tax=Saguinus oedipus TaxID=9490 RepID=A0ABQ9VTC6_SAGOE|nr:hypothetical protein P7K49_012372 [Saguinus oedipus]
MNPWEADRRKRALLGELASRGPSSQLWICGLWGQLGTGGTPGRAVKPKDACGEKKRVQVEWVRRRISDQSTGTE